MRMGGIALGLVLCFLCAWYFIQPFDKQPSIDDLLELENSKCFSLEKVDGVYYEIKVFHEYVLSSGPEAYVFNATGELVDYIGTNGEFKWHKKWYGNTKVQELTKADFRKVFGAKGNSLKVKE